MPASPTFLCFPQLRTAASPRARSIYGYKILYICLSLSLSLSLSVCVCVCARLSYPLSFISFSYEPLPRPELARVALLQGPVERPVQVKQY